MATDVAKTSELMVHNNKVLTVSYGTFSCTLEGFEDSFGTMKAIAEYFRDLAADDRYFGAEPPQPDADMLARIAQREIARQVEARTSEGGIHLRAATPALGAAAAPAPAPAAEPAAEQPAPAPAEEPAAAPEAAQPAAAPEPVADTAADEADTQTVEAAAAATAADDAAEHAEAEAEAEETVAAALENASAGTQDTERKDTPAVELLEVNEAAAEEDASTPQAAEADEQADEPAPRMEEAEEEDSVPAADSIAAKLQRIRAVVAQAPEEDFSEDEHADDVLENAAEEITSALMEDDGTGAPDFDDEGDDEIARTLDRLDLGRAAAQQPETTAEASAGGAEDGSDGSLFADLQDGAAADRSEDSAARSPAAEEDAAQAPEPAPAPRVRITKVKRTDFDKALASGRLQDTGSRPQPQPEPAELSEEDEADLMRELAEVEAEILAASELPGEDSTDDAAPDTAGAGAAADQPAGSSLADSDVSRLMAAADAKLEDPESASSREAYSHLRAAVAAAKAGPAGGTGGSDDAQAYREDLASVVRPRRPEARHAGAERPPAPASRPAPLKLVAAQRIDQGAAADQPVRPRRVSAAVLGEEAETGGSGFAAYAAERGAAELHELLEAAAAYMSFVEGRDHFSRPQLMNKVRSAGSSEFNREDGLRSFGQLLRDGKIERSGNGRFTASGDIGFKPGKRAAG